MLHGYLAWVMCCVKIAVSLLTFSLFEWYIWHKSAKIYIPCWKFHMQVALVYLHPFRCNSVLKCAQHPKIAKKYTKNPFLGVQGRSRSSMLINLKSLSLVLVMISSMYVPICNRFHIIRANNGKMVPLFDALVRGEPLHPVARNFVMIN